MTPESAAKGIATLLLVAVGVSAARDLWHAGRGRGLILLWWACLAGVLASLAGSLLALHLPDWPWHVPPIVRWTFSGQGRFLNVWRWLKIIAICVAGVGLISLWDWIIYVKLGRRGPGDDGRS